jgi:hypothetical protein
LPLTRTGACAAPLRRFGRSAVVVCSSVICFQRPWKVHLFDFTYLL